MHTLKEQRESLLSFEFAGSDGKIQPLTFRNPMKIISATTVEEVMACLMEVEKAVDQGFYAAGYLSYEAAQAFDKAMKVNNESKMPLLWFGIYAEPQLETVQSTGQYTLNEWVPSVTVDEYHAAIKSIKESIEYGDTYQTNYTIRLHSSFKGDNLAFFDKLRRAQSSNYCAYLQMGDYSILSASPELFFQLKGNTLTTRPMKGTIKRGKTAAEDEAKADELYHSDKNRAENVMIVDLLRNDLSVVAKTGTVKVEKLFDIERYPTVHQMTSTITAEIKKDIALIDIFKALFPCGSITGAPKIRTMEIIEEMEGTPREVYCGTIGYITPEKEAIFNVPIRTVMIENETGKATYGVGGGITWDSTAEDEYDEVIAKALLLEEERPRFSLLESLLLSDGEYFLLHEHLQRLQASAKYFNYSITIESIRTDLLVHAASFPNGDYKVRLLVNSKGEPIIESQPMMQVSDFNCQLADQPVDQDNAFLYHKTTNRKVYEEFQRKYPDSFDVLLWNKEGELTEFTNGNLVVEMDDAYYTPPVSSGLLAGTFRNSLIQEGRVLEKTLTVEDLEKCQNIWFINSVRKWVPITLI
ncbi:aminodeoxychorismate synthase component I [Rummeliibacillus stabekisii]|uniref:aminodeoxychorismate synthase component I n=1 Tax=Rummeliibacillus stabekisii TaxID=241244 RepID=UPI00117178E5|nr:aminodeoxychorismate synthase component I [Rummeliibacillus stabekisii]MBB5171859.1 para-aminobenzoate synthetase/4-amino-4-deoxychorismate lyase [Rummeliibacillus stabekisii]GEL06580.1 aminodeoxychorismate synthase, component I [Rummeliibacillus stabekisii]